MSFRRPYFFWPPNHRSRTFGDLTRGRGGVRHTTAVQFSVLAMSWLLASTATSPASAQTFSSLFQLNEPPAAAVGTWHTTVIKDAAAVAARDRAWTATVAAIASSRITTGSIARAELQALLPGPRITGKPHALSGEASYYWQDQMTATGERFDKRALTAAHKTLPFGTRVRVTRVDTGTSVVVRINDRGPYKPGRIIDLSEGAAEAVGMTGVGITPVRLEVLGQ